VPRGDAHIDAAGKANPTTRATPEPEPESRREPESESKSEPRIESRSEAEPASKSEPEIESRPEADPRRAIEVAGGSDAAIEVAPDPAPEAPPAVADASAPLPDTTATAGAVAARVPRTRTPLLAPRRWHAPAAIAALALLLVLQMLLADRAQLAADAQWRPSMLAMCAVLGCDLPPWREPDAFVLLDRDVRPDPAHPGVLQVHARFRNDARWPQRWPALALALSDADGRVLGARVFTSREYLAMAGTQNGIASGQVAAVSIRIREPGPGVVAFTFDFR
jgi:hypothetical protein